MQLQEGLMAILTYLKKYNNLGNCVSVYVTGIYMMIRSKVKGIMTCINKYVLDTLFYRIERIS